MKRKDLVVGLDVAVKSWGTVRRAVLLELGTKWVFSLRDNCFRYNSAAHPAAKPAIAIAAQSPDGTWLPDVVECRHLLMSWSDYEVQQQRDRDERDLRNKEQTQQRDAYEKLRSRCAELLKIAVQSPRLGVAEVQLNDLYAIACAMEKHTLRYDDTDQPSIPSCMALDSDRAK